MTYQEFTNDFVSGLKEYFPPETTIFTQEILKNNDTPHTGLIIHHPTYNISPTIYLEPFYEKYLEGYPLDELRREFYSIYVSHIPDNDFDIEQFTDFTKVKEHLIPRLVHYENNKTRLETVPHRRFLDLAIVYHCHIAVNDTEQGSILIHNQHLSYWDIDEAALHDIALENAQRLFPFQLENLHDIITRFMPQEVNASLSDEEMQHPIYILTNKSHMYGASVILYEHLLKRLSEQFRQDLILLPSSIHEFLLLPAKDKGELSSYSEMVRQVNLSNVPVEEQLSDHAYYYSQTEGFC